MVHWSADTGGRSQRDNNRTRGGFSIMCIQKYIAKAENGMSRQDLPQLCPDAQILVRNQKMLMVLEGATSSGYRTGR